VLILFRYLGARPIKLFQINIHGESAVLALSSRPWLNYSFQRRAHLTPLTYDMLEYGASFHSEQCPEAVVAISENNLRIFSFDKLGVEFQTSTIPLSYTPRRFVLEPYHRNFVVIESDHGAYPSSVTLGPDTPVEQFGLVKAPKGHWASCIRVLNPLSGDTLQRLELENNEAAVRQVFVNMSEP
jgi:splicing factor 3B subunit 3